MEGTVLAFDERTDRFVVRCDDGSFAVFRKMMGVTAPAVSNRVAWTPQGPNDASGRMCLRNLSQERDDLHVEEAWFGFSSRPQL